MAGVVVKASFRRRTVRAVAANVFRYLVAGAARSWARNIGGTAPALGSMTLLLLISGVVGVTGFALYNLEQIEAGQASLLHVYLRDDADGAAILALMTRLETDPRVASVRYTTKAEALKRAQAIPGLTQLADSTESNPFPASLDVQAKSIDDVGAIDASVRVDLAVDPVYPTSYDRGAYERIQSTLFWVGVAGAVFLGLLGFVAVSVTVNSIKAAIHARRDEVRIMELVGAPRWMVRGPFLVEGAITGALAGVVAGAVTFGLTAAGVTSGSGSFTQVAPGLTYTVGAVAAAIVLTTGLVLGSGASLISVRRHLES